MHIYFSGIGGAGIGPLAEIAYEAGYNVSGSDKQDSSYIHLLKKEGIGNIFLDQSRETIAKVHAANPIDWLVYSSSITIEQPDSAEIAFARNNGIKVSKRDELINAIAKDNDLSIIAVAGTHGKTTTTAMIAWLANGLKLPLTYLLPAKTSFGPMGKFDRDSHYFLLEADEFDRNFLSFEPWLAIISGVSWDHHEIFPSRESYQQAFSDFISQSRHTILWQDDANYLNINETTNRSLEIQDPSERKIQDIRLIGLYNRLDAWLALQAIRQLAQSSQEDLLKLINRFPGLSRRMEKICSNLYSDYAHTPEKIRAAMSVAQELAEGANQPIVVVYEPLTNRRQHYIINDYKDCFSGAAQVYWLPSYLAREDPSQRILPPSELIARLSDPAIAQPAEKNEDLKRTLIAHMKKGDLVIGMAGGGGGSLDDWLRDNFN